ncbi:MAG TPA: alpha/beta fold hydrolase [Flavobacterium sp.]
MKYGIRILGLLIGIYVLVCLAMFANQESLIFLPEKLPADFKFQHRGNFTELDIPVDDDSHINGLLFKTANPRGLIFYLHGNAGSLKNWGNVAETYNLMGYDVFIMDYRGFGKSGGNIGSEQQFFSDVQIAYNHMKAQYQERTS